MRRIVLFWRTAVLLCFITLSLVPVQAQSVRYGKVEVGAGVGPLIFLGDLGGNLGRGTTFIKDVNLPTTNLSLGLQVNVYPTEWLGFRVAFNSGKLEGADSLINEKGGAEISRKVRNQHFRSKLTEGYAAIEFYPTVFFERYDGLQGKLRPYGLIGVGMFRFNPQTQYYSPNGTTRWVDLRDLRTEGQGMAEYPTRKQYNLTQVEIPMGIGAKYYVSEDMYVGLEVLHRKTFTDYIDDLSTTYINPDLFDKYLLPEEAVVAKQVYYRGFTANSRPDDGEMRGQKKNNDAFFSTLIRCGWRFGNEGRTPGNMRCPKF
ncbi:MAG: hypothetical protein EOO14_18280 [Chitinophagaceae bacterium]|nr:MAG: hypothetical protein EOO14_18280 [Chitinophagaceae bacterium]